MAPERHRATSSSNSTASGPTAPSALITIGSETGLDRAPQHAARRRLRLPPACGILTINAGNSGVPSRGTVVEDNLLGGLTVGGARSLAVKRGNLIGVRRARQVLLPGRRPASALLARSRRADCARRRRQLLIEGREPPLRPGRAGSPQRGCFGVAGRRFGQHPCQGRGRRRELNNDHRPGQLTSPRRGRRPAGEPLQSAGAPAQLADAASTPVGCAGGHEGEEEHRAPGADAPAQLQARHSRSRRASGQTSSAKAISSSTGSASGPRRSLAGGAAGAPQGLAGQGRPAIVRSAPAFSSCSVPWRRRRSRRPCGARAGRRWASARCAARPSG